MTNNQIDDLINKLPKAELHLHIEGSLEPDLMFEIARRNKIELKYDSLESLKLAYSFNNLQEFLDIYYEGAAVLIHEKDFYDMTWAYFEKAASQGVVHAEIFFDPQTHTERKIPFATVIQGISSACNDARTKLGISSKLIMCFLRHLDEESAINTLKEALKFKDLITAVGLDSSERGNPPSKFKNVYKMALEAGWLTVAHAGEEGPADYVREALDLLMVSRIDHGNHALDDENLVKELVAKKIPLTVCPLSNLKLKVVQDLRQHPLKTMLDKGLLVTINSDDPAYFGGYIGDNYLAVMKALNLTVADLVLLAKNSFQASFLKDSEKLAMIDKVDAYSKQIP